MTERESAPPQIAVWLFLAATFAFAGPSLYEWEGVLRWNSSAVGFLLMIAGGIRLGVEIRGRRASPPEG